MSTLTTEVTLETITCWGTTGNEGCGIEFAIPWRLYNTMKVEGVTIYCPRGHRICFGKSDLQKATEEIERLKIERNSRDMWLKEERNRSAALRGEITKAKKRIGRGACPCCNRYFSNVDRHMATKHPDFHKE